MEPIRDDPDLLKEMVSLLGRELKTARRTIEQLKAEHAGKDPLQTVGELNNARQEIQELRAELERAGKEGRDMYNAEGLKRELAAHRDRSQILETELLATKERRKKARQQKRALREKCNDLEARVVQLVQENASLDELLTTANPVERTVKGQTIQGLSSKQKTLDLDSIEFKQFLWAFKAPRDQPDWKSLSPVYNTKCTKLELKTHLASLRGYPKFSSDFLYFPGGRFRWNVERSAIAFGPLNVFTDGDWRVEPPFAALDGQALELFYASRGAIYYAGTYKCHTTRRWFPEGVRLPSNMSAHAIVEASQNGKTQISTSTPSERQVLKMYTDAVLNVDCLVLECMGFDHAFYTKMLSGISGSSSKRETQDQGDSAHRFKRRKP